MCKQHCQLVGAKAAAERLDDDLAAVRLAALTVQEKDAVLAAGGRRLAADILNEQKIKDKPVSVFDKPATVHEWWKNPRTKAENVVVTPEDWATLSRRWSTETPLGTIWIPAR